MEILDINIGQSAEMISEQKNLKVIIVDVDLLEDNPINKDFYEIGSLEEIQKTIEERELLTPLIVVRDKNGKYRIISGHRRKAAALNIFAKGKPIKYCGKEYMNQLPVSIHPPFEGDGETKAIVDANVYRDKSDEERKNEISFLYGHYKELKENGGLEKGDRNIVEHIANDTKLGKTKTKEILNQVPEYQNEKRSHATKNESSYKTSKNITKKIDVFVSWLNSLDFNDYQGSGQEEIKSSLNKLVEKLKEVI